MKNTFPFLSIILILLSSCSNINDRQAEINIIAEEYVKLALHVGTHSPIFVDAYYGPAEWKPESKSTQLDQLIMNVDKLITELSNISTEGFEEIWLRRVNYLNKQLTATKTYCQLQRGEKMSFDEQCKKLFDAISPVFEDTSFDSLHAELDKILPGEGDLSERYNKLKNRFIIPEDKVESIYDVAIAEVRKRTKEYIDLPENENFTTEYVTDEPWGAYNWYKGNNFSLIQINVDSPKPINSPLGLSAHEGYPGHHVYNVLLESELVGKRGWVEYSVYPLFSPQSFIAEGTANYGMELMFTEEEKIQFEKEVLFPIAGLKTDGYETYRKADKILGKLGLSRNNIARDYLEGNITEEEAKQQIMKYSLSTEQRAEQSLRFINTYGAYVITYNIGEQMVKEYVERLAGDDNAKRWEVFRKLLSMPSSATNLL